MGLTERAPVSWLMSHLHVHNLLSKTTPSSLLSVFEGHTAGPVEGTQTSLGDENSFDTLTDGIPLDKFSSEDYVAYVKKSRLIARELGLGPGQKCLVINGRVSILLPRSPNVILTLSRSLVRLIPQPSILSVRLISKHLKNTNSRSARNLF